MDDLSEKLAGLLNDPETMENVKRMAENLLGNQDNSSDSGGGSDFFEDAKTAQTVMNLLGQLKGKSNDSRTQLLYALKPLLSEPKREKVDTAIKILRVIEMLPLLKGTGLLDF